MTILVICVNFAFMNISLNPTLEKYIKDKAATGMYNSTSEVVREALRLLQTEDEKKRALISALQEGMEDIKNGRVVEKTAQQIFEKTTVQK